MMNVIDGGLHGQRYHLKTRTKAWFVVEKQEPNAHAHGGICVVDHEMIEIEKMFDNGLHKKVFGQSATYDIQTYRLGWAGYAIKRVTDTECLIILP